ncbi:hypothetical protein FS935_00460 [Metabacillus litoralis]|uniref:Outer membrane protein assembly factor BamE n=1 Tax=Metabacillus litoralis TaxID=152268 RepID=A0A5C6W441_9BACI|nr:hypothetical protein [Metabacillus litoralis]TXC92717.1 hypothetical protein FS935_00460 [Metabacillus litoralis]
MTNNKWKFGCFSILFGYLYGLLYLGYILFIIIAQSSFSIISIPAILIPFIIFLVTLLFIWKRVDIKNDRNAKKNLNLITIMGIIPFLICLLMLGINEYRTNFSTEKWVNNMSGRVHMVDDLINTYDLKGKSKSDVMTLLGPPTDTEYFKDEKNIVYYLGNERGIISIDSEWLIIDFEGSNKVKDYVVRTD